MMVDSRILLLGGVRSGKSRLAEWLAARSEQPVCYIATAEPGDKEMQQRVEAHRASRPAHWQTVEEPIHLAAAMNNAAAKNRTILVDCLTLWLTNLLMTADESCFERERAQLLETLPTLPGRIVLVSNETNMGITPLGELSRRYCDEAGRLHQELAVICDQVVLMVAGLPITLKGETLRGENLDGMTFKGDSF